MQTIDLEYINQGLFTAFVPVSKAGETAWNEMATFTDGTGKILTIQAKEFVRSLRKAGYIVRKAKPVKNFDADALLAELEM